MTSYATLSAYYAEQFHKGVLTLESITRVRTFREVLTAIYWELVREGKIKAIEELPETDKRELWAEAIKTELDKEQKIKYCRAIYTLNFLL